MYTVELRKRAFLPLSRTFAKLNASRLRGNTNRSVQFRKLNVNELRRQRARRVATDRCRQQKKKNIYPDTEFQQEIQPQCERRSKYILELCAASTCTIDAPCNSHGKSYTLYRRGCTSREQNSSRKISDILGVR